MTQQETAEFFELINGANNAEVINRINNNFVGVNETFAPENHSVLRLAVDRGNFDLAEFLLQHGADANSVDVTGVTVLMAACAVGRDDIADLLLSHGAALNNTWVGLTPVNYARIGGYNTLTQRLVDMGGKHLDHRTVIVTGAGFSKGFYDNAPLLVDTYEVVSHILPKYLQFPAAHDLLQSELRRQSDDERRCGLTPSGRVNLERLLTRIAQRMPYDTYEDVEVLTALLTDVKQAFVRRIEAARNRNCHDTELESMATYCLNHDVSFITFNYDTLFDEALRKANRANPFNANWRLRGGYGFYCASSSSLIGYGPELHYSNEAKLLLLKVHGSMNWYTRLGSRPPYQLEDFVHHEPWGRETDLLMVPNKRQYFEQIESSMEPAPFIVPPVLSKSDYMAEPLLRKLWAAAYRLLRQADRVIFVGYSLPMTDLAAAYLFREGCVDGPVDQLRPDITVVDYAPNDPNKQASVKAAYRTVFPDLQDNAFNFAGALMWAEDFVVNNRAAPTV